MSKTKTFGGYVIEKDDFGRIISITGSGDNTIRLGQMVQSNGRIFAPQGTKGIVVKISEPFTLGHSTNVISVWFENQDAPRDMKFKDLEL